MRLCTVAVAIVLCLCFTGCGEPKKTSSLFYKAAASDGVELLVERDVERQGLLVTFSPDQSKEPCHLYDTDLPLNGLAGVGRPTRVELVENALLAVAGKVHVHETLIAEATDLKSYPAGPVHISMPLQLLAGDAPDEIDVTLLLTYMACGDTFCCPPVTQKEVQVRIPREWCRH